MSKRPNQEISSASQSGRVGAFGKPPRRRLSEPSDASVRPSAEGEPFGPEFWRPDPPPTKNVIRIRGGARRGPARRQVPRGHWNSDIQELLAFNSDDLVGTCKMGEADFTAFEREVSVGGRFMIDFHYEDGTVISRTIQEVKNDEKKLTPNAVRMLDRQRTGFWRQMLVQGKVFDLDGDDIDSTIFLSSEGSDRWEELAVMPPIVRYEIRRLIPGPAQRADGKNRQTRSNRAVAYWPTYNDTDLDLNFAQMYKKDQSYPIQDQHCIVKAFEEAKNADPSLPYTFQQLAELMVKYKHQQTDLFDVGQLSKVCTWLKVQANVEKYHEPDSKTGKTRNSFSKIPEKCAKGTPVVPLAIICEHIFFNRSWPEISNVHTMKALAGVPNTGKRVRSVAKGCWTTARIVNKLMTECGRLGEPIEVRPDFGNCVNPEGHVDYSICDAKGKGSKSTEGAQRAFSPAKVRDIPCAYYAADTEAVSADEKTHTVYSLGYLKIPDVKDVNVPNTLLDVKILRGPEASLDLLAALVAAEQTEIDKLVDIQEAEDKRGVKRNPIHPEVFTFYIFFHNLRYDRAVIQYPLAISSVLEKDGAIYSFDVLSEDRLVKFCFRDSSKLFSVPLTKWSKELNLPSELTKKEQGIFYEFFSETNRNRWVTIAEYAQAGTMDTQAVRESQALAAINDLDITYTEDPLTGEIIFPPDALFEQYLRYDVAVLAAGLRSLSDLFKKVYLIVTRKEEEDEEIGIFLSEEELAREAPEPLTFVSLASYAKTIFAAAGCREGTYEVSGSLRKFQMGSVRGGRTTCHPKFEGSEIETLLDYFDGCALYPSAMLAECLAEVSRGYPRGPAFPLTGEDQLCVDFIFDTAQVSAAVVSIRLFEIRKRLVFAPPIVCVRRGEELVYTQDLTMEEEADGVSVTLNHIDLQQWIEHHDIVFEIEHGCYWKTSEGFNVEAGGLMRKYFNERLKVKKSNPSLGNALKLFMNTTFGTSVLKICDFEQTCVPKDGDWKLNLYNSFHNVHSIFDLGETIQIQKFKPDQAFTYCIFGSMVLARARWVMNGLWKAAEASRTFIFYTDTDSVFLEKARMERFALAYEEVKHPALPPLVGTQLLQFHSDFSGSSFGDAWDPATMKESDIFSVTCLPVRKKMYIHKTAYVLPDGKTMYGTCRKMKGCTEAGFSWLVEQKAGESATREEKDNVALDIYRSMLRNTQLSIPLNPGGRAKFYYDRTNKTCKTSTKVMWRSFKKRDVGGGFFTTDDLNGFRRYWSGVVE